MRQYSDMKRKWNSRDVANSISGRRQERGRTATDLAREVGVSRSALTRLEGGTANPSWGLVLALAQALDLVPMFVPREQARAVEAFLDAREQDEAPPLAGDSW